MIVEEVFSFENYGGFINETQSSVKFSDPHFSYSKANLFDSLSKPNRQAYVVKDSEEVLGLFVWLIIEEEKYIEMLIGLTGSHDAFSCMLEQLEISYPSFQFDLVIYPRNQVMIEVLINKKTFFDKPQQKMVFEKFVEQITRNKAILLTEAYENQYRLVHNDNVYWTSERVIKAKDKFRIFVMIIEDRLVGYLDVTYCFDENEIYSLWVDKSYLDKGIEQALLLTALEMNPSKKMVVFVDCDALKEIKIYESVGFKRIKGEAAENVASF